MSGSAPGKPQYRFHDPTPGYLRDDQSRARGQHARIGWPTAENSSEIRHKLIGYQPTKHYDCRHDELVTTTSIQLNAVHKARLRKCGLAFSLSKSWSAALQDGEHRRWTSPHPPTETSSVVRRLVAVMSVIFASLVAGYVGGQPAAETPTTLGAPTSSASFSSASQRELQDHVIELSQRTVNVLPAGNGRRFLPPRRVGRHRPLRRQGHVKDAPANHSDSRDLKLPPGSDYNAAVAHVGDI